MVKQAPFLYRRVKGALVFFIPCNSIHRENFPQGFCCCYYSFASFSDLCQQYSCHTLSECSLADNSQFLATWLRGFWNVEFWNVALVGMVTVFAWSLICSWSAVSQISSYTSNRVRGMRSEVRLWKLFSNICKSCAVSFLLVRMSQVVDAHFTLVVGRGRRM